MLSLPRPKAEARQTTCFSLSPKSNPEYVYYLLRPVACSSSAFSSSPNFPNCSTSRKSALVFANYLRFHFSVSQPKALHSRARSYLSELRRVTCPEESHASFSIPFYPLNFLRLPLASNCSLPLGRDKIAYPMLMHLLRSGMDFILYIFHHSFHLEDIFCYSHSQNRNISRFFCFLPAYLSLPPAYQSLLNALFYPIYSSF